MSKIYFYKGKLEASRAQMVIKRSKIDVLGVKVDDISLKGAISEIIRFSQDRKRSHLVVTVNSEFVMLSRRDPKFSSILAQADLSLADGIGVVFSKLIFGGKIHERITGVDLIENLCTQSAKKNVRIGFLGGFDDVAEEVASRQKAKNPGLLVVFAEPGDPTMSFDLRLKRAILRAGRIDVLFVAYGMGQQEFWIKRFLNWVDIGVFIGVGGAFDYLSSVKIRAPKVLQNTGFEWLWRLALEPRRIRRMWVLPIFLFLVLEKWLFNITPKQYKS